MNAEARALIEARGVVCRRRGEPVLRLPEMTIAAGERLVVIGPNGAGKSTLLLALARLLRPQEGTFLYRGVPYQDIPALEFRRKLGLVMQSPLLLRASVWQNVALGLKFRHLDEEEIRARVARWLDWLQIAPLADRPAHQLSGGEAQRVSLARAFALEPEILLLDEPFSALDAQTRWHLLADFKAALARLSPPPTLVLVTHDLDVARSLGERVAVLMDGSLRQLGAAADVFARPRDCEVARFVGMTNLWPGRVVAVNGVQRVVELDAGEGKRVAVASPGHLAAGSPVWVGIRPEHVYPASQGARSNVLAGPVQQVVAQGPLWRVHVGGPLGVVMLGADEPAFRSGEEIRVYLPPERLHLMPRE